MKLVPCGRCDAQASAGMVFTKYWPEYSVCGIRRSEDGQDRYCLRDSLTLTFKVKFNLKVKIHPILSYSGGQILMRGLSTRVNTKTIFDSLHFFRNLHGGQSPPFVGGGGHSLVYLLFVAVYWSRQPRVFQRLTSLLCITDSLENLLMRDSVPEEHYANSTFYTKSEQPPKMRRMISNRSKYWDFLLLFIWNAPLHFGLTCKFVKVDYSKLRSKNFTFFAFLFLSCAFAFI